jgi:hypothetical protein
MKFIDYVGLRDRGIPGSKITIWRKERENRFPRRTRFSAKYYGWPDGVIDAYLVALAAGHDEQRRPPLPSAPAQRRRRPRDHWLPCASRLSCLACRPTVTQPFARSGPALIDLGAINEFRAEDRL